jgi:predicted ribosome quality control (RQC) complex YloA/Tae2 family protein
MRLTRILSIRMIPPMNSLTIYALGLELERLLRGSRISAVFAFRGGVTFQLDEARLPLLHLLYHRRERALFPAKTPIASAEHCRQCMKAVRGARVSRVRPLGMDRIVLIELVRSGDWEKDSPLMLRIDLLPFNSAAALYHGSKGSLLESVGPNRSRPARGPEETPPSKRYSILELPVDPPVDFAEAAQSDIPSDLPERTAALSRARHASSWLLKSIGGVDPLLARQIARTEGGNPGAIWRSLRSIGTAAAEGTWSWHLYNLPGRPEYTLYPVSLPFGSPVRSFPGWIPALDAAAGDIYIPSLVEKLEKTVTSEAAKEIRRLERLSRNIASDISRAERSKEMRHFGNLLVTYRHLMKSGLHELSVKDFSGDRDVTIPLDPAKPPDQNIQLYFKRAKKGERGLLLLRNRRRAVEKELKEKMRAMEKTARITNPDELLSILPQPAGLHGRRTGDEPKRFRSFELDGRHSVLVGRNDRENDLLTHRIASPGDLWFHAQGSPGSHVILKGASPSTPKRFIEVAAAVAAFFSKARHSTTVPVICAEKRYVRKPRKSKPGTAVCQRSRTIFVRPRLPDDSGET